MVGGRAGRAAALIALALAWGVGGCTEPGPPPADQTAADLAKALASGDFTGVTLKGASAAEAAATWDAATSGLDPLEAAFEVQSVAVPADQEDGAVSATAILQAAWSFPGEPDPVWSYTVPVAFDLVEDSWQAVWEPSLIAPELAEGGRLQASFTTPKRGDITGAGGATLVTERPVVNVGLNKPDATGDLDGPARQLAARLGVDPDAYAARVEASGSEAFVSALTIRAEDLPGYDLTGFGPELYQQEATLPLAPTREFARQVLGTVGEATAETIEDGEGRIMAGDLVGLSGLQQAYDQRLRGKRGVEIELEPPAEGAEPVPVASVPPEDGLDVAVTLDPALQQSADDVLAGIETAAALVAVKPSTGELLAVASGAGGEGYSTATLGLYPPGSTFKVVTALALLRAGLTPDSPVACPATIEVDGRVFANYSDYPASKTGEINLLTALAQSCNTAFVGQAGTVSPQALADAARDLGVAGPFALGIDAGAGAVPLDGSQTEKAAALIGQGKVQATPLAMAVAAASIQAGRRVSPVLVTDPAPAAPDIPSGEGVSAGEAGGIGQMMRAVVTQGSGGILGALGGEVRAKTGTAEYGEGTPPPAHAWMIATDGDLAVAVFVADGGSGAKTAGPLVKSFLAAARQQ